LHLAAKSGSKGTIALLLKYKHTGWFADDDITPLHLAASYGRTAAVKQITRIPGHDWKREGAIAPEAIKKIQASMSNKSGQKLEAFSARKTFSARELAVIYGHVKTALAFPSGHDDDHFHAVSCACMLGDVHAVEVLWNHHNETRWFFESILDGLGSPAVKFAGFQPHPFVWLSCQGTGQRLRSCLNEA
jgi:hypothetical protein